MPTLRELMKFVKEIASHEGMSFTDEFSVLIESQIRQKWPGERVYLIPHNSRKDPSRGAAIIAAASRLPTGIVSERFGVTRQYVGQVLKKGNNPAA